MRGFTIDEAGDKKTASLMKAAPLSGFWTLTELRTVAIRPVHIRIHVRRPIRIHI
jgi:hypothetical protein